jgi:hypothetical protein
MDDRMVGEVVVRMRLDLSVLGKCRRVMVSRVLFNALHERQEADVLDPDFTCNLVFRGVPVVHSADLNEQEYAFVTEW